MTRLRCLFASRHSGLLCALMLLLVGFGFASEQFRDPVNLLDRSRLWIEVGLVAVPMTFIIAAGGIDLSVGSLLALSAMVAGVCLRDWQWPLPLALGLALLTGTMGGAVNGFAASVLRVPALVATLATLAIFRGLAMGLSHGQPVGNLPEAFEAWGGFATVGKGMFAPPQQLVLLLLFMALGEFILRKTRAGRWTVQLGENETAARYAAIPVSRVRFGLFLASGFVCGLGATTSMAYYASARPNANIGLELDAIACVIIGGTRITGGGGSVSGTFLGLLFLGLLRFGLEMLGVLQQTQTILVGLLVVFTAILNEWLAKRPERSRPAGFNVE
jgi:rhamnose transport system permease protein